MWAVIIIVALAFLETPLEINAFAPDNMRPVSAASARRSKGSSWSPVSTIMNASSNNYKSEFPNSRFIRIQPRRSRGSRQSFELQTAVVRFERSNRKGAKERVDLHAQVHYGNDEYFDYYNSHEFNKIYDNVLYELLVDESLLKKYSPGSCLLRHLSPTASGQSPLMASPSDQQMAKTYGLACQVDHVNYAQENWIHADLTRQELLEQTRTSTSSAVDQPLWALASSAPSWPGVEAVMALFRPTTPSTSLSTSISRRLFSNLFLPGHMLLNTFRALFWVTLPCPELSVVLLDWSSLLPRPTGGVSQVTLPVLGSLLSGNILEARQLVFGQVLVNGQRSSSNEALLIQRRNERAMQVLEEILQNERNKNVSLLYGGMHCGDLQDKLRAVGFVPARIDWRTAWSVTVPQLGTGALSTSRATSRQGLLGSFAATASPAALAVGLVVLPFYFFVGGMDWISAMEQVARAVEQANVVDATLVLGLYLIRHLLLYVGLSKFVVEWDGSTSLFGANGDEA
jgi:hypothetical protein